MKFLFVFIWANTLFLFHAFSQDLHFSQYWSTPLLVNPALTGQEQNNGQLITSFRNQWNSVSNNPYRTFIISADRFIKHNALYAGFFVMNDRAGDSHLSTTQAAFSLATRVKLNKKNSLKLGLQGGFQQHSFNADDLTWGKQFDGISIDPSLANGEPLNLAKDHNFDCSSGLLWEHEYKNGQLFQSGFAVYHLNRPAYSMYQKNVQIPVRWTIYSKLTIPIIDNALLLSPSLLFMSQASYIQCNTGLLATYNLGAKSHYTGRNKPTNVISGLYYRWGDAIIICGGLCFRQYIQLLISYDINISRLVEASHRRGGLELTLSAALPSRGTKH